MVSALLGASVPQVSASETTAKSCQPFYPEVNMCQGKQEIWNKDSWILGHSTYSGYGVTSDGYCANFKVVPSKVKTKSCFEKFDLQITFIADYSKMPTGCNCFTKGSSTASKAAGAATKSNSPQKSNKPAGATSSASAKAKTKSSTEPATTNTAVADSKVKSGSSTNSATGTLGASVGTTSENGTASPADPAASATTPTRSSTTGTTHTFADGSTASVSEIKSDPKNGTSFTAVATDSDGERKLFTLSEDGETARKQAKELNVSTVTKMVDGKKTVLDVATGRPVSSGPDKSGLSASDAKMAYGDACTQSELIAIQKGGGRDYRCSGTNTIIKVANVGSQVLQTAGSTVMNTIGGQIAASAANGTQSSIQKGIAKAAKSAATYQAAVTGLNLVATAKLAMKTSQHRKNASEIASFRPDENGFDASSDRVQARYAEAIKEQQDTQKAAAAATYTTAMGAVKSAMELKNAKATQKGAEKLARQYASIEAKLAGAPVLWDSSGPVAAGNGNDNTRSAATSGESSQSTSDPTGLNPDANTLGNGNDIGGETGGVDAPKPGEFKTAAGGPSGGGGGSAGGAAAGGAGAGGGAPAGEETKAGYASEFGTKERYEVGGGAPGGKGGGKAAKEESIDLNGLLAQFLPKSEEDVPNKNGILDFANHAARAPAAMDENGSYLDKNADLFQRIHETMSEKNRRGHVGI